MPKTGWRCDACMDAASTFHQLHERAVELAPTSLVLNPRVSESRAELAVRLGCMGLPREYRQMCFDMRASIIESHEMTVIAHSAARARKLLDTVNSDAYTKLKEDIEAAKEGLLSAPQSSQDKSRLERVAKGNLEMRLLRYRADPYTTCFRLGECHNEPADVDVEDAMPACQRAFLDPYCAATPDCEAVRRSCEDRCQTCAWLIRSWPAFEGKCEPPLKKPLFASSVMPKTGLGSKQVGDASDDAMMPRDGFLSSSLEETQSSSAASDYALRKHCHAIWWAISDLEDVSAVVAGTSGGQEQNMMGPYRWTPQLACGCMGQCPYDSVSELALFDAGCLGPSSARESRVWEAQWREGPGEQEVWAWLMRDARERVVMNALNRKASATEAKRVIQNSVMAVQKMDTLSEGEVPADKRMGVN